MSQRKEELRQQIKEYMADPHLQATGQVIDFIISACYAQCTRDMVAIGSRSKS